MPAVLCMPSVFSSKVHPFVVLPLDMSSKFAYRENWEVGKWVNGIDPRSWMFPYFFLPLPCVCVSVHMHTHMRPVLGLKACTVLFLRIFIWSFLSWCVHGWVHEPFEAGHVGSSWSLSSRHLWTAQHEGWEPGSFVKSRMHSKLWAASSDFTVWTGTVLASHSF